MGSNLPGSVTGRNLNLSLEIFVCLLLAASKAIGWLLVPWLRLLSWTPNVSLGPASQQWRGSETPGVTVGQGFLPEGLPPSLQTSSCPPLELSYPPLAHNGSQHTPQGAEHPGGKVAQEQSSPGNGRSSLVVKAWATPPWAISPAGPKGYSERSLSRCMRTGATPLRAPDSKGLCPAPSQMLLFLNEEIKPQIKKKKNRT